MFTISDEAKKAFLESLNDEDRQNLELVNRVLNQLVGAMMNRSGEDPISIDTVRNIAALMTEII
ncbi:MAG: hypothetical protein IKX44_07500 [Prevotella sp.]|nr:hypothetical protein [Prevotella sp.]